MFHRYLGITMGFVILVYSSAVLTVKPHLRNNPGFEKTLCRFYLCDDEFVLGQARERSESLTSRKAHEAVVLFQELLRRDSHSPFRWLDLSQAYFRAGAAKKALDCLNHAVRLGPNDTRVRFRAGNLALQLERHEQALDHFMHVLSFTRDYDDPVFRAFSLSGVPIETVLDRGLPDAAAAGQAMMRYLLRIGSDSESLRSTWAWLAERSYEERTLMAHYVDVLVDRGMRRSARDVYCSLMPERCLHNEASSLVLDPELEEPPARFGLGWQFESHPYCTFVHRSECEGARGGCLTVRFRAAENLAFRHLFQRVVVGPGEYRFLARVRANGVTTDQGPAFEISDADQPSRLRVRTETVVGSTGWIVLESRILTADTTELLDVRLVRDKSMKLDNRLRGSFEIDSVWLEPVGPYAVSGRSFQSSEKKAAASQKSDSRRSGASQRERLRNRVGRTSDRQT